MKRAIALILLAASLCALTACNTVQGFGKDVQTVGEKMQNASKKDSQ